MKGHEKRVSGVDNPSVGLVPRLTPSRAVETALGREISPQWEISKFASGKEPTGLFARKHLLTPYTGEAIIG